MRENARKLVRAKISTNKVFHEAAMQMQKTYSQQNESEKKVFLRTGAICLLVCFLLYSEMVAPLDVYHNVMGVALSNDEKKRSHRHRRHHHSQQRHHRSTGHMKGYDPKQAEVYSSLE